MSPEKRLVELGLELPPTPKPVAVYRTVVVAGNIAYVSGHGPLKSDGTMISGRVGADLDLAAGKVAAARPGRNSNSDARFPFTFPHSSQFKTNFTEKKSGRRYFSERSS